MLRKKRGQMEIQFNWIFVLIAGALILAFFISVVNKQREVTLIRTSSSVATNLESIFTGAEISTNTVNVFDLPQTTVDFECGSYAIGSVRKQTGDNAVFAPKRIEGRQMITWARDWSVPYRIMNFLYLTDPVIRYVIVNNSKNLGKKIYDTLPREMNKEVVSNTLDALSALTDRNDPHIRFVFLGVKNDYPLQLSLQNVDNDKISAIAFPDLVGTSTIPRFGKVEFYEKQGNSFGTSPSKTFYMNDDALYGAIYAGSAEDYNCAMRNAFSRMALVSSIYVNRSLELQSFYGSGGCFTFHHDRFLSVLETVAGDLSLLYPPVNDQALSNIQDNIVSLKNEQNRQLQLLSCELVY
ncbi:MAG: hypothetical protein O2779_00520 [Nanoarchaeota archaeon]|nr:hypothetical protein [Nanoarchaeota archaeon]